MIQPGEVSGGIALEIINRDLLPWVPEFFFLWSRKKEKLSGTQGDSRWVQCHGTSPKEEYTEETESHLLLTELTVIVRKLATERILMTSC